MRALGDTTVLFVSSRAGHLLSRVERRWLPVMEALLAEGASVLLVAPMHGSLEGPARELGVTIAPYRLDRWNLVISRNRLRSYLKRYRPSIAVATGYEAEIALRWAARDIPVKVVSVSHCGGWPPKGFIAPATWFRRRMDRDTRPRVDAFVVDCAELAEQLVADGVSAGLVHVDVPSVDLARVERERAAVVALPDGGRLVGYAGALERSRGLGTLAAAATAIRESHPDVRVVIAGEGPARLGLLPATLDGRVELVGRPESVPAMLARFDVCCFPSNEPGVPTPLLEAAALGRPIVATDCAGIRELFADGAEIVLVPRGSAVALAEAVGALLDDPERARSLGQAARHRVVDEYSSGAAVGRWLALLRSLLA